MVRGKMSRTSGYRKILQNRRSIILILLIAVMVPVQAGAIYLHVGQPKAEVVSAIGQPNYTEEYVDADGKYEKCQWGSERVGTMVIIIFKNGRVHSFRTYGKVR